MFVAIDWKKKIVGLFFSYLFVVVRVLEETRERDGLSYKINN